MHGHVDDANVSAGALEGLSEEQTERLTEVLDRYLAGLEAGEPLTRQTLLAEHADLRESLTLYLEKLDELHNFSAGFSPHLAGSSDSDRAPSVGNALLGEATHRKRSHATPRDQYPVPEKKKSDLTTCDPVPPEFLDGQWATGPEGSAARRLGDFELLRVVGRGGMGIVYEAQQVSLQRRVALKLLPLTSLLDSRQIARFKNEAQAAAALQHPNIVPVFAVGSYQGVHYYAMRLIDGHPLDAIIAALRVRRLREKHIDEPAKLAAEDISAAEGWDVPTDMRRVIRLGIEAALALAAAHEEGIIHRDIKPSNLLVDRNGKLWITDFGLARRINDHSLTATGDVLGTLRYMSPEQASGRGALVDARSDIYSLGVTLYELLTLVPAVAGASSPALLHAIEQQTPLSLRHYRPELPRDLVTVLDTAMAKNREERYLTAQHFADDLVRVLEGRPTLAKPPSLLTRASKWAARHHRLVAAAAIVLLCAGVGLGISTSMIVQKNTLAQTAWKATRHMLETNNWKAAERLHDVPGAEGVRRQLLIDQLSYYQEFASRYGDVSSARADVAAAQAWSGKLQRELGKLAAAESSFRQAYALYHSIVAAEPRGAESRRELATCANRLAQVLAERREIDAAEALASEAVRLQEALLRTTPSSEDLKADLAESRNNIASLWAASGKREEAERMLDAARTELMQLVANAPKERRYQKLLVETYNHLGSIVSRHDPAKAATFYEQSLSTQLALLDAGKVSRPPGRQIALTYSNIGMCRVHAGQLHRAIAAYKNAIRIQRQLTTVAPSQQAYARDLSVSLNNLGLARMKKNQLNEAESCFSEAVDLQQDLIRQRPEDASAAHDLGGTYNNLATLRQSFPDMQTIDAAFEKAIFYQREAQRLAPETEKYREFLDNHLRNYSQWLRNSHRDEPALAAALERRILWSGNAHKLVLVASDLADAALDIAGDSNKQGVAQRYADAAMETLSLAQKAGLAQSHGLTVHQLLSQQPFSSLAKMKSPTD